MNTERQFQSIWCYQVKPAYLSEFKQVYSSNGQWSQLFTRCEGYIKTVLKQNEHDPHLFLTIDYWKGEKDYLAMKSYLKEQYQALDHQCEVYTSGEQHIGYFVDTN